MKSQTIIHPLPLSGASKFAVVVTGKRSLNSAQIDFEITGTIQFRNSSTDIFEHLKAVILIARRENRFETISQITFHVADFAEEEQ